MQTRLRLQGSAQAALVKTHLSNLLDLWFERAVKPRLRGEACMVRYIDDFVMCFQYRGDAPRVLDALRKRLGKLGLNLEPTKTKLAEFGRDAQEYASKRCRKRPETIYFSGFTLHCTRNRKGDFRVGLRTEKSRLRRALMHSHDQMRRMRHEPIQAQVEHLNQGFADTIHITALTVTFVHCSDVIVPWSATGAKC